MKQYFNYIWSTVWIELIGIYLDICDGVDYVRYVTGNKTYSNTHYWAIWNNNVILFGTQMEMEQ